MAGRTWASWPSGPPHRVLRQGSRERDPVLGGVFYKKEKRRATPSWGVFYKKRKETSDPVRGGVLYKKVLIQSPPSDPVLGGVL